MSRENAMRSVKYLEILKKKNALKSDRQLALLLNMGTTTISQYMNGKRVMDEESCLAVALALEINPVEVMMAAGMDRAEKAGQKSLWEVFSKRITATTTTLILFSIVTLFLTPPPSQAALLLKTDNTINYIM